MTIHPTPGLHTRLTERFGLTTPVLNAPMALVAGGALAAAVSRAGGLGCIGGGYAGTLGAEPDLGEEYARAGDAAVGIGFITWALDSSPAMLDAALALAPRLLFLSFGDPRPHAARICAAQVPLVCQIQRVGDIDAALEAGAIALVAQGSEAGGHGGARGTLSLVVETATVLADRSPDTLLLAAGGIADGRGLAAALMLGADGVVLGTRLWATREALTHAAAIARAIPANGDDTVRTRAIDALRGVPWPPEYSFRVLRNALTDTWGTREHEAFAARGSLQSRYDDARRDGNYDVVVAVAGEAVAHVRGREPAAEVIVSMTAEARTLLRGAARFVVGA